ncbi:MAG: zinc-dependent peptidase, partial [Armatimonadetes bacterium]|nr:zinc-dependent peptidase [Armatimonadota bacterium]
EIAGTVDKIAYVVNADGSHSPLSLEQREILIRGLKQYGIDVVRNLQEAGLRIALVDETQAPEGGYAKDLPEWPESAAGYYDPFTKTVLLGQQSIGDGNGQGYFVHEVGHAIDDFFAEDIGNPPFLALFRSDTDKKADLMYEAYQERSKENPSSVWSPYAATSKHEYVAEGMRYYLDPELRKQLAEKDPELYAYVEAMLAEASKPHGLGKSE